MNAKPRILIADGPAATYVHALEGVGAEPVPVALKDAAAILGGTDPEKWDLSAYDGLLLPGGDDIDPSLFGEENHGSRTIDRPLDDYQLGLCGRFVRAGKPVLGICKGAQVINVYFGGKIIQDLPDGMRERHTYHSGQGTGEFHGTTIAEDSFLFPLYGVSVVTNSYHHQALGSLGRGLKAIQWADDQAVLGPDKAPYNVTECIVHETLPVIGTQWHPEKNIYETVKEGVADGEPVFRYYIGLVRRRMQ